IGATDDTGWEPLGSGVDNSVAALAASNDYLYVSGYFRKAGGVDRNRIARWDLDATHDEGWSSMGSGMDTTVGALAVANGYVYIGAGGTRKWKIGSTDDSGWSTLGSGIPGLVDVLLATETDLYAGGHLYWLDGVSEQYRTNIVQWTINSADDSGWTKLGSG